MDDEQIERLIEGIGSVLKDGFDGLREQIEHGSDPGDASQGRAILYKMEGHHGVPSDTDALMWIRDELVKLNENLSELVKAIRIRP